MSLHPRSKLLRKAETSFGVFWLDALEEQGVHTYTDANYVVNHLDAFWNNASRKEVPVADALASWKAFDTENLELGPVIRLIGDYLAKTVVDHELTYAEVNSILVGLRSFDAAGQLRAERYPEEEADDADESEE